MTKPTLHPPPELRAYLLGDFVLECGERALPLPKSTRARSLLAHLLLHRQEPHSRTLLAGLLWPDHPERKGRRALSHALWQLNKVLPHHLTVAEGDTLHIPATASIWVDVVTFSALVTPHLRTAPANTSFVDLYRAVGMYRGDLLCDYDDEWIELDRWRLRQLYHHALERLIAMKKRAGRYQEALELARMLLRSDPLREASYRTVMSLCLVLGRAQEAQHEYEACRRTLDQRRFKVAYPVVRLLQIVFETLPG